MKGLLVAMFLVSPVLGQMYLERPVFREIAVGEAVVVVNADVTRMQVYAGDVPVRAYPNRVQWEIRDGAGVVIGSGEDRLEPWEMVRIEVGGGSVLIVSEHGVTVVSVTDVR